MKLQRLQQRVPVLETRRLQTATRGTERIRGRAGQAIRERILTRDCGLCQCDECKASGYPLPATEVDHLVPLWKGGAESDDNRQSLNWLCHLKKSQREAAERAGSSLERDDPIGLLLFPQNLRPSTIPLTIVCGPAGGGKSTYIRERQQPGDLVIDMDMIRAELGIGHSDWDESTLTRSLARRNELLASLTRAKTGSAWFIVSAATARERAWWRDALAPTAVVVVMAPEATCIDRITKTRTGERATRSLRATRKWAAEFTSTPDDTIVLTS